MYIPSLKELKIHAASQVYLHLKVTYNHIVKPKYQLQSSQMETFHPEYLIFVITVEKFSEAMW